MSEAENNTFTVFYSWQSDRPNTTNRRFIEDCLKQALTKVSNTLPSGLDPVLDRDIKGKTGAPDIPATILAKIDVAQAFVGDVSIVEGQRRLCPNPNVLIELGYAAHSLSWERIVLVCNEAFGKVEDLPFDIRHRSVVRYSLISKARPDERKRAENELVGNLVSRLKSIAGEVKHELETAGSRSLARLVLRELKENLNRLIAFMLQAANLPDAERIKVEPFFANVPRREDSNGLEIGIFTSAFTNKETLLQNSGVSVASGSPLTWSEFLKMMLEITNSGVLRRFRNMAVRRQSARNLLLSLRKYENHCRAREADVNLHRRQELPLPRTEYQDKRGETSTRNRGCSALSLDGINLNPCSTPKTAVDKCLPS